MGNAKMAAIADYLLTFRKPSVSTIHIVVFQAAMMKDFEEVMKQYKKVTPKPSGKSGQQRRLSFCHSKPKHSVAQDRMCHTPTTSDFIS